MLFPGKSLEGSGRCNRGKQYSLLSAHDFHWDFSSCYETGDRTERAEDGINVSLGGPTMFVDIPRGGVQSASDDLTIIRTHVQMRPNTETLLLNCFLNRLSFRALCLRGPSATPR